MERINNKREIQPQRLYTVRQAAILLEVHRVTIYAYIRTAQLEPQKHGAHLLFPGSELIKFREGNRPKKGRPRPRLYNTVSHLTMQYD